MSFANGISDGNPWGVVLDGPPCPNCNAAFEYQFLTMMKWKQRVCNRCKFVYMEVDFTP